MKRLAYYSLFALGIAALTSSFLTLSQAKTTRLSSLKDTSLQTTTQTPSFKGDVSGTLRDQGLLRTYYLHTPAAESHLMRFP